MPKYSKSSLSKLATCHQDIQAIFHYVIKQYDNTVVFGLRTAEEQYELYKKGRKFIGDEWLIEDEDRIVTYRDGFIKKSNHQSGMAIDVIPYPGGWHAKERRFFELAGTVKATAYLLKKYGDISHDIEWGYDLWEWDLAHFQLKI